MRNLRGHIPETLLQTLMAYNSLDPIFKHLVNHFVAEVEEKRKEGKDLFHDGLAISGLQILIMFFFVVMSYSLLICRFNQC